MGFDLHRKKLSVAIILGTLAICALLLAQGATSLLATWALPVEATALHVNLQAANLPALPGTQPPNIQEMLKRNIFDPTTGPLWPPKPSESEDLVSAETDDVDDQSLMPGEMPPACEGSMRLVASVYAHDHPEWSFATVTTGSGAPLLYRAGADLDGKQVDSIYPKAVFLKSGGRLCSLTLFEEDDGNKTARPKPVVKPTAPVARSSSNASGVDNDDLEKNIQKVSETKYNVNRELVTKVLSNQAQLMRSARVVPHEQDGQVVGVKLYGIRRQSVLGKLGLQNGDLLRNINGYDMGSPNSALEAYARLRSADALSVAITRRGQPVTLEYGIVE